MDWIKNKVLALGFVAEALSAARKQGGVEAFPLAQKDVLETMRDDLDKQAEELAEKKLAALLSPVDPKSVLTINEKTRQVFIGGELADQVQLTNLVQEAQAFRQFFLYKVLIETPKSLAERAMFLEGDNIDQMKKGRTMLYTLSTQVKNVDVLADLKTVDK